jgi:adenosylcobinamide-GDP ribazoletransferase
MPPLFALQFLTRIPVPGLNALDATAAREGLAKSVVWFPAVGGLVGAITALTLLVTDAFLPRAVAVVVALIVEARLTGAFHEDAVADFCDGFGGGMTPQRIHEIMKDSRVGSYGALGLCLAVGLRAVLLVSVPGALLVPAVIASACVGRYLAVCVMAVVPPFAQADGLAKDVGKRADVGQWLAATLLTVPFVVPLAVAIPLSMAGALCAAALFTLWFRRYLLRHLGGVTGDCLGFGVYIGQLIVLLSANIKIP